MHEILKSFWLNSSMSILPCVFSGFIPGNFLFLTFPDKSTGQSKQTHEKLPVQALEDKGHKEQLASFNPAGIIAVDGWFSALQFPTGAYISAQKLARLFVCLFYFLSPLFLKVCTSLEKCHNRAHSYSLLANYQVLRCIKSRGKC